MNTRISSICLIRNSDGVYWKITLVDESGNVLGTFGDECNCDDINFRKQTFYLLKILNNWDLLKIDGQEKSFSVLVDNEFSRINCIANYNGDYLKFDYATGEVLTGSGCDTSQFFSQKISSLLSRSGVFTASIIDKYSHRAVSGDMSYLGFTEIYPNQDNEELEIKGSRCFKEFVCGILDLCNINELIQSSNYPEVSVKFDSNGNIIAIGDIEGNEYLYITENGYKLINGKQRKR